MKVYVANAFTIEKFGGNPAAVVPLRKWLSDALLQDIAMQHNLPETAFIVPEGEDYFIRWFTPVVEVDLCGHATLASAHILFNHAGYKKSKIVFHSKSGPLYVTRGEEGKITMDFPTHMPIETQSLKEIEDGLKTKPLATYLSTFDYMVVLPNQEAIEKLSPDFRILAQIPVRGVLATAKGNETDFVSRCFFPQSGIDEDPVTGSAHTVLTPYWANQLGKTKLTALQLSKRQGRLDCEFAGERVFISGHAVTYSEGKIMI